MRLFIAVLLDPSVRDALADLQSALRRRGMRGNFSKAENLHLTLAFIGEYGNPEPVLDSLSSVPVRPFSLSLDGLGNFRDLYWCGIRAGGELAACAKRVRRALAEAGIPYDRKRFTPHITLVRRGTWEGQGGLPDLAGLEIPEASMEVRAVSLMRSDRGRNGMIYTEIGRVSAPVEENPEEP